MTIMILKVTMVILVILKKKICVSVSCFETFFYGEKSLSINFYLFEIFLFYRHYLLRLRCSSFFYLGFLS